MKVGDYVRTKDGYIGKISKIQSNERNHLYQKTIYTDNFKLLDMVLEENIIKSSPNIIDLIEVGDYVNGYLVKDIDYAFDDVVMNNKNARIVPYIDCNKNNYIEDIKSIVTKEMYSSVEYRVEIN